MDQLLSGEELLTISEEDNKKKENHFRDMIFGLLDISFAILMFLPFFGQKTEDVIQSVSLLSLTGIAPYLKLSYSVSVAGIIIMGILTLALQRCEKVFWVRNKSKLSLLFNIVGVILFVISQQPYAAIYLLIYLLIKVCILVKWQ